MAIFGKSVSAQNASPTAENINPESPEHREECVRNDISIRLRSVCEKLPEAEFEKLVAAMTRVQLRSERRI